MSDKRLDRELAKAWELIFDTEEDIKREERLGLYPEEKE